jgi:hypothetical protein
MWIPESEQEISAAIEAGDLVETSSFDAKRSLPTKGKSKDLAIDVAAMASDGGVLLYGVGEDEDRRPTVPQPFRLAGARERVDQIVRTSISEPPDIQVRTVPTDEDASLGYLVVAVPPSPRAPHMVTVGQEYRYYGMGAAQRATCLSQRVKWPACTNGVSGGRLIVMPCSKRRLILHR